MLSFQLTNTDNNKSYPSPTDLTTNATYNAEAEREYKLNKTGVWRDYIL